MIRLAILLLALACSACVGLRAQPPARAPAAATHDAQRGVQPNPYIITSAERRLHRALRD